MGAASPILGPDGLPAGTGERQIALAYELPLGFVDSYEGIVETVRRATGVLPTFGWQAGDANAPSHWLGAVNAIDRLAAGGAPVAATTPYQLEDGTAVASEDYLGAGAQRAQNAVDLDPAAGEDVVVVALVELAQDIAGTDSILGTFDSVAASGWFFSQTGALAGFYVDGAAVVHPTVTAGLGTYAVMIGLLDRDANVHFYLNGTGAAPVATPGGTIGNAAGIALANWANGVANWNGRLVYTMVYNGAAAVDPWSADTFALVQDVTRRATGIPHRVGYAGPTFARATASSWQDSHTRRHALASAGLPRAGSALAGGESGIRLDPAGTNKCYSNVNITVAAAAVWGVDDASAVGRVDDSAALAAATEPAEAWGPFVCDYNNTSGAARYCFIPGSTGNVNAHSLQVMARIVAGAGAQLGFWDTVGLAFSNGVALSATAYVRTLNPGLTPPSVNEQLCIMIPNGCHVRWIAYQSEEAGICSSPIPNWSTVAGAARGYEYLDTPQALSDTEGRISCGVTPMGWSGAQGGTGTIITRVGGTSYILYASGGGNYATFDGTSAVSNSIPAAGVERLLELDWGRTYRILFVDGAPVTGGFDGAWASTGHLRLYASPKPLAIADFRVYRRPML